MNRRGRPTAATQLKLLLIGGALALSPFAVSQRQQTVKLDAVNKQVALARSFLKTNDLDKAENACKGAVRLLGQKTNARVRAMMGEIDLRRGLADEAMEHLSEDWRPGDSGHIDLLMAVAGARCHNSRASIVGLDAFVQRNADVLKAEFGGWDELKADDFANREAVALMLLGREETSTPTERLVWLGAAIRVRPNHAWTSYFMGKAYADNRDWGRAKRWLNVAIEKGSGKSAKAARDLLNDLPGR